MPNGAVRQFILFQVIECLPLPAATPASRLPATPRASGHYVARCHGAWGRLPLAADCGIIPVLDVSSASNTYLALESRGFFFSSVARKGFTTPATSLILRNYLQGEL
jgi:hypothetical protein